MLEVPATESEEALVLRLLDERTCSCIPGYFFDFAREAFLVVSLLPRPGDLSPRRIARAAAHRAAEAVA